MHRRYVVCAKYMRVNIYVAVAVAGQTKNEITYIYCDTSVLVSVCVCQFFECVVPKQFRKKHTSICIYHTKGNGAMNAMSESGSMEFDIFENEAYVNIRH